MVNDLDNDSELALWWTSVDEDYTSDFDESLEGRSFRCRRLHCGCFDVVCSIWYWWRLMIVDYRWRKQARARSRELMGIWEGRNNQIHQHIFCHRSSSSHESITLLTMIVDLFIGRVTSQYYSFTNCLEMSTKPQAKLANEGRLICKLVAKNVVWPSCSTCCTVKTIDFFQFNGTWLEMGKFLNFIVRQVGFGSTSTLIDMPSTSSGSAFIRYDFSIICYLDASPLRWQYPLKYRECQSSSKILPPV